jgi:N-acetylglucosaminyldiphosphoundecaprenol N-acetyl-beta-D-mannosaminyltransferase
MIVNAYDHAFKTASSRFYRFLGIQVNALTINALNLLIEQAINDQKHWIIGNHNLHSMYLYHKDLKMRNFYKIVNYVHVDGMILVLIANLFGFPLQRKHRVTYVDWTPHLIATAAEKSWRIFYLGGKPGVAEKGAQILRHKFPALKLETADGYFTTAPESPENQAILSAIQAFQPNILMVGMSMPRQEHWILDNLVHLNANIILPAGAALDYVAGAIPTPPRWAGRLGLEWLFRLVAEPKRLWQRYLIEPLFLLRWFIKNSL